ncbi:hypothetical protein [Thiohalobacter thiocyanaticus]|uniref:Uncharacterized protein n=1 Tax=Thiohalobacter thiocyanaticus TaxID=585455 RepID=A0A426QK54_9GAMM|nr:hypothetical protein [Thiohalobacter thiocyanaticus]RRQ22130.1 hypothetical protein D6C00_09320 [Thiohalobacter thiocyanaticus]
MSDARKTILVIAQHNKPEALRMATGLTLLDDEVRVSVLGELGDDQDTLMQMEALEFAEAPVESVAVETEEGMGRLADSILGADAVYVI